MTTLSLENGGSLFLRRSKLVRFLIGFLIGFNLWLGMNTFRLHSVLRPHTLRRRLISTPTPSRVWCHVWTIYRRTDMTISVGIIFLLLVKFRLINYVLNGLRSRDLLHCASYEDLTYTRTNIPYVLYNIFDFQNERKKYFTVVCARVKII